MDHGRFTTQNQYQQQSRGRIIHDAKTDEIIRFVRDYQGIKREPTELGLHKKAVLPGIGVKLSQEDSRRNSIDEDYDSGDAAYESDLENDYDVPLHESNPTSQFSQGPWTRSKLPSNNTRVYKQNIPKKVRYERKRRLTADVRHLPPIDKFDLPDRPEAPAPIRERPKGARGPSPTSGLVRENTRIDRPSSARPQTRHARRMELIREYSFIQDDSNKQFSSPRTDQR